MSEGYPIFLLNRVSTLSKHGLHNQPLSRGKTGNGLFFLWITIPGRRKEMKCPKCKRDMTKVKEKENVYYFKCPHCGHTVGKPEENADKPQS